MCGDIVRLQFLYLSWVQCVVLNYSMCTHPYRLCLKAIILANRPDSRPWMCLVMCIVWLSHDIWSVYWTECSCSVLFFCLCVGKQRQQRLRWRRVAAVSNSESTLLPVNVLAVSVGQNTTHTGQCGPLSWWYVVDCDCWANEACRLILGFNLVVSIITLNRKILIGPDLLRHITFSTFSLKLLFLSHVIMWTMALCTMTDKHNGHNGT